MCCRLGIRVKRTFQTSLKYKSNARRYAGNHSTNTQHAIPTGIRLHTLPNCLGFLANPATLVRSHHAETTALSAHPLRSCFLVPNFQFSILTFHGSRFSPTTFLAPRCTMAPPSPDTPLLHRAASPPRTPPRRLPRPGHCPTHLAPFRSRPRNLHFLQFHRWRATNHERLSMGLPGHRSRTLPR